MSAAAIDAVLRDFEDAKLKQNSGYAYCSGYYSSLLARILADLPATKRARYVNQLIAETKAV